MGPMLKALLTSAIVTLLFYRSSTGFQLLRTFAVFFAGFWITFYLIQKIDGRKKQ